MVVVVGGGWASIAPSHPIVSSLLRKGSIFGANGFVSSSRLWLATGQHQHDPRQKIKTVSEHSLRIRGKCLSILQIQEICALDISSGRKLSIYL